MTGIHSLIRSGSLLLLTLVPVLVVAQWDPGATAQLGAGHGFNALSQSTLRNAYAEPKDSEAEAAHALAVTQAEALWQQLQPEFRQRLQRDGEGNAMAWLRHTAFELGRRAGPL